MFGKESSYGVPAEAVITLSVLWSFKTCLSLHEKATKVEKTHLETTSKILVVLISFFASAARILSIICFFVPFFGLFDLLHHHKAEQIPFSLGKDGFYNATDMLELYNTTPVRWGEIDRWDYTDPTHPTPPSYNTFTYFTLAQAFKLFWLLIFLHLLIIFLVKVFKSQEFRKADNLDKAKQSNIFYFY